MHGSRNTAIKKKCVCLFIYIFLLVTAVAEDGEFVIQIPQEDIDNNQKLFINWLDSNSLFCVTDNTEAFIVNANKKKIIRKLRQHKATIIGIDYNDNSIVTYDQDNTIILWDINTGTPKAIYRLGTEFDATSIAIKPQNDAILVGLKKGLINGSFNLQYKKDKFKLGFRAHRKEVYSLNFNYTGKYLISASLDGTIKIWETEKLKQIQKFNFYAKNKVPVNFSPTENLFASCQSKNTISIRNLDGEIITNIKVKNTIKDMKFSQSGQYLLVLNDLNEISLYKTFTGKLKGIFKPLISSEIFDFDMSPKNRYLLSIYKNGEVYRQKFTNMFIPPVILENKEIKEKKLKENQKKENIKPSTKDAEKNSIEKIEEKESVNSIEKKATKEKQTKDENKNKAQNTALNLNPRKKMNDTIELGTSFTVYENKYFIGSLNFTAGYNFYQWTAPFYFGIDTNFGMGFPKKKFPYQYSLLMNDNSVIDMKSPYLMLFGFFIPLGFTFEPFNNGLKLTTELYPGLEFNSLWNGSTKYSITSKMFITPSASLFAGVGYKFFIFNLGVGYNKISKFSFTIKLDFNIEMNYSAMRKKKKNAKVDDENKN